MVDNSNYERSPAFDTGPIPVEALSDEEIDIIGEINKLLRRIKESAENSPQTCDFDRKNNSKDKVWARPVRQLNNVILLDGGRGTGKTSLLLTMIDGWSHQKNYGKKKSLGFEGMNNLVRALTPIDFDPLPPELPIYSWIIQAFYPLVQSLRGKDQTGFLEEDWEDDDRSLMGSYRKLQRAATVGWTTGLMKQSMGKDAAEYLLWQDEQQINWQKLQTSWRKFIQRLLHELHHSKQLPLGGLIVLPIDDLDLQVTRARELLLAIRVLRHDRLVYLLTGDKENTDLALSTSFSRNFTTDINIISGGMRDIVEEQSGLLGKAVRKKTIPSSQTFTLKGIGIAKAMRWKPPSHERRLKCGDSMTVGNILDGLFGNEKEQKQKLSRYIRCRSKADIFSFTIPFRPLQNFCDRWSKSSESSKRNIFGLQEFLKLALEDPKEDPLYVGISDQTEGIIDFTGEPVTYVAGPRSRPRSHSIPSDSQPIVTTKWIDSLEFYRKRELPPESSEPSEHSPATPQNLLAFDLVHFKPSRFQVVGGLEFIGCPFGFIWTEIPIRKRIVLWPVNIGVKSPARWYCEYKKWKKIYQKYEIQNRGSIDHKVLLKSWAAYRLSVTKKNDELDKLFEQDLCDHMEHLEEEDKKFARSISKFFEDVKKGVDLDKIEEFYENYNYVIELSKPLPQEENTNDYITLALDIGKGNSRVLAFSN